ncbi:type IV pili methyl-accepting chemotaxis transducer N-terminal domain-containing protein [Aquimarina mytili]|uniref:Type IV pili methyl-accepting chemotaxis transducer N-terminal domain-containing protein n=1 Tax=Aquimarina mytili TaxID=874423 RepID=A0A937A065_9FLAO|nr:type IV pili methyl-accepting chemotaxis transducer N-terminal domain-containing protein [Aquimarina mytili]MBL0682625.1 type IV pili methyl-accepting chemotaxis transducer N-terminal domain-containing protein [Aquimarina mytili]
MKTKIISIFFTFTLLCVTKLHSQSQSYGSISYNKAVNISGKQRMLSQKMSKAYLLLAKGINNKEISKELNSSKFIFDKQLEILTQNASSTAVKLSIKNVKKFWSKFKGLISTAPSFTNSLEVMELNTKLLSACHELVLSIETSSKYNNQFFKTENQDLISIINVSGKQRMLSQRLCLYYTASSMFPNKKAEYRRILNQVFEEFDSVIGDLLISSYNTTEIEEELGNVMSIWEKFQSNKKGFYSNGFTLEEVFYTSNNLTKSFNKITGIYELIAKST